MGNVKGREGEEKKERRWKSSGKRSIVRRKEEVTTKCEREREKRSPRASPSLLAIIPNNKRRRVLSSHGMPGALDNPRVKVNPPRERFPLQPLASRRRNGVSRWPRLA